MAVQNHSKMSKQAPSSGLTKRDKKEPYRVGGAGLISIAESEIQRKLRSELYNSVRDNMLTVSIG